MKRLLYIICVLMSVACSKDIFEEGYVPSGAGVSSQISPSAYVSSADMPPAATKALINTSTVASMEANALRIDENIENDMGRYEYEGWQEAYLLEATVSASPANDGLRSMYLNPVQAYKFRVVNNDTTDFYHTRMVSWYPRTAHLHKNSEGNAVITKFKDFKETIDESIYGTGDYGRVVLNFSGLDGSKDVMVSNIVEGQHWHSNTSGVGADEDEDNRYTYPFGDNPGGQKKYRNVMTYKHYMSAIKVYAYTDNSEQDVSMWGALNKVMVKNQPSGVSVTLPSPRDMNEASVENFVQNNALDYGEAAFSSELTDFPLIKTPMYGEGGAEDQEVAPDSPHLEKNQEVYLGYALIRPNSLSAGNNGDSGQKLELEVHTDAGALTVEVDMTQTVEEVKQQYFQPGYIYTIRINFNTEGAIAGIVMRAGDDHYYDLSSGEEFGGEVHDHKYANCYIVHDGLKRDEEYYDGFAFTATTIGNGPTGLYSGFYPSSVEIDPVRAGLLWESESGLITQVELIYGYVRFKVKQDGDGYKKGNAVIAVYDSQRKVLWSWHIWVAGDDAPKDVSYTVNGNTIVLLDRNLGATDAGSGAASLLDTYGLYYQWGRKDPSMGPPEFSYLPQSTATMNYYDYYGIMWNYAGVVTVGQPTLRDGVENPMYLIMPTDFSMTTYQYDWLYTNVDNLWGDYNHAADSRLKTIYDPCPFGYMVPQDEISTLFATKSPDMVDEGTGYTIQGTRGEDDSYDSFFPFAGYKGVDKGVSSLTGAWKYVGHKGDYMSSKIEGNGHRSRTYISDTSSWIEYGADSDNDGDGDASRTYQSNILADDMTNRRTAASVRCVKRTNALNASLVASFVGDRTYAFVRDGKITFNYDVRAYGSDVSITSAMVDLDGVPVTPDPVTVPQGGSTQISGSFSLDVPSTTTTGLARYRLIANTSKGSVSRVSYVLRLFDLSDVEVKIGEELLAPGNAVCKYGEKYPVSFTLTGLESDFSVYVNGVQAVKGEVSTDANGLATISYSIESGVYIPGHLNIQIRDAEGGLACQKSYEVAMSAITSYQMGEYVNNVKNLEAGALYMIKTYQGNTPYWLTYSAGKLVLSSTTSTPSANNVFLFHRDDTKAGGVSANYRNVSAGAWRNLAADAATPEDHDDGFFTESFDFGTEAQAAYTTCANGWGTQTSEDIDLYLGSTGKFLYYRGNPLSLYWGTDGNYHSWKWVIYKVTVPDSE